MTLPRPTCTLTVDTAAYTGSEAAVRAIAVDLSLGDGHDQVLVDCSHLSPLRDAQSDTTCSLSLGYADDEVEVFNGWVNRVEQHINGVQLELLAATLPLSRWFGTQTYQDQTVADIVSDLAGQAGVATGTIDASSSVTIWHVNEHRPAWWHISRLAAMGDYELLCEADGALSFRPVGSGGQNHTLRYGADILSFMAATALDAGCNRQYAQAGAGSELGSEKWHVVLRDPAPSPQTPITIDGALRNRDAAQTMTDAQAARHQRSLVNGRVLIMGNGAIRPGDTIELSDLPSQGPADARVRAVHHRLDANRGFTTWLDFGGAP